MQAFANRLQKVNRHIAKWAKRQGISCYRIYDLDMPEFPFCIDRYDACVHVAEYKANHRMPDEEHTAWLEECMNVIASVLEVPVTHIYLKERRRLSRRTEQYEKVATESKKITVQEDGLQFLVNLTDYLDTGLFLDHRPLRKTFRAEAAGKSVLNLFSYTGAFSVYAAAGGAEQVTTVDLSNTYLQWARENMDLNGLMEGDKHTFVQSDVMDFLKQAPADTYDLVFVDPPAFSNSKKMKGTWDTQRDHPALLYLLLKAVKSGGIVYFSNNLREFSPSFDKLAAASIKDISLQTIPEDFRNKKIHHCYRIIK
ncbi:class I SAM-dependent methyltransferase [Taibaiella chishuiensis]|uniref:23S rRNA (Cytosine1962-C5)-methyltransferase n=1 Tax=Taibaiella chishuiensis TaxID=1434707 RepID=A0A2P8DA67_9BACT|nr:class I SAM-dependent methyltransferase [Taibaiella chishuiensis]PSK94103.1 23S rRNA (cytosine1962-C5)-methyltransferase [Taibaiella chishuiensis]